MVPLTAELCFPSAACWRLPLDRGDCFSTRKSNRHPSLGYMSSLHIGRYPYLVFCWKLLFHSTGSTHLIHMIFILVPSYQKSDPGIKIELKRHEIIQSIML